MMMSTKRQFTLIILLLLGLVSCQPKVERRALSPDEFTPPTGTPAAKELLKGISFRPEQPQRASDPLTIVFQATEENPLYNYEGDIYVHIGVATGPNWGLVPAKWEENIEKCKMTKVAPNTYELELKPSIREWFGAPQGYYIPKLGIVLRSADGKTKAYDDDIFVTLTGEAIQHQAVEKASLPAEYKEGINIAPSGTTATLVLNDLNNKQTTKYAHAYVLGNFNNWQRTPMKRDDHQGVWWLTLEGLAPGEHLFQYELYTTEGEPIRLADPYSEKVLFPHDNEISSTTYPQLTPYPQEGIGAAVTAFNTQPEEYQWQYTDQFKAPEADDLIIYELLLRDFSSTGDLQGALKQLPRLKALGINAIELLPVQEFDGNDSWGYNPSYYFALDKAYGTKNMYKQFIDECHKEGIAVIFDVVYNHLTGDSPLARMYYDFKEHKVTPENGYFNVVAPHPYSVFNDLNHEAPRVRQMVKRNLQFLLKEYRIDGFRFDLTKGFTQRQSDEGSASNYDASRVAILKDYNSAIKEVNANAYVILEHFTNLDEEKALAQDGMMLWRKMNEPFAQAAMGYQQGSGFGAMNTHAHGMPTTGWVTFMESHDEERLAYNQKEHGVESVKNSATQRRKRLESATAFFLLTPGPKMIWQFGEAGYDISIEQGGRTAKKPVFTTAQLQETERKALADTYSQIIKLRLQEESLFENAQGVIWQVNQEVWNNVRTLDIAATGQNRQIKVIGNFHPTNQITHNHGNATGWRVYATNATGSVTASNQQLNPGEFAVLVNF